MAEIIKWPVVLVCPGEDELPLLAELSTRRDARILAVIDPEGFSVGASLAEVMGVRVIKDLGELAPGSATYLVHPPLSDNIALIVDQAPDFGLEAVSAFDFPQLMAGPTLTDPRFATDPESSAGFTPGVFTGNSSPERTDFDLLELETAAIHRTLSRIEEALDREGLLRWLLALATRATCAGSGSIMLFDSNSDELYVAFAYGLSQHTIHRTRVRMGEGIAGQVAESRKAVFITDNKHPGARRDRPAISEAICAPIVWEGKLLGVLNISANEGEGHLVGNALATIEGLTHRFAMILNRFLRLQTVRDGELYRYMEDEFTKDTGSPEAVAATLCTWAEDLCNAAGADTASIGVLTNDGDLFVANPEETTYESPPQPEKADVLGSGNPLVLRPGDRSHIDPTDVLSEATIFILPVGREPLKALLTVEFSSASKAHHFHTISGELLYLVNRHLNDYLERAATADQVDRLTTLATALSELAAGPGKPGSRDRVLAAACRLTGATKALLLTAEDAAAQEPDKKQDGTLQEEAIRLLTDTGQGGWQSTVLETRDESGEPGPGRSLLVVPLEGEKPFPGLVLLDKRRLHPLDGASFTEFDALFARRLLPLLSFTSGLGEAQADGDLAGPPSGTPDGRAGDKGSYSGTQDALAEILRTEMDRCDRYHTMLGLAAFRIAERHAGAREDKDPPKVPVAGLVAEISRRLRSSDHTASLEDGTIMVIVPEDIQSLPRLQRRVTEVLRSLSGTDDLEVLSASRVYPGGGDSPAQLINSVLGALPG
ncbi:MAG: GAF domain-containing protein [Candidatus Krumholzibacteriota bacterium]